MRPSTMPRSCAPFAASGSGRSCASAPTTSSATAPWKRSPPTCRGWPTPPCEVALATAQRTVSRRFGRPTMPGGKPARCVVLAFGKHGGEELNYSSDIDLMFVFDEEGSTADAGRLTATLSIGNDEFFARSASEVIRLAVGPHRRGQAYRVDLRLRPEGQRGPLARSLASTLVLLRHPGPHLGTPGPDQGPPRGRRPRAGPTLPPGHRAVRLSQISHLRRDQRDQGGQAAHRAKEQGPLGPAAVPAESAPRPDEVKTGQGGIRDIEFTIQFLQLLNGGDLPEVRQRNTLLAMASPGTGRLPDRSGISRPGRQPIAFCARPSTGLQLLFDLQTHQLPAGEEELNKLACGWATAQTGRQGDRETRRQEKSPRSGRRKPSGEPQSECLRPTASSTLSACLRFLATTATRPSRPGSILDHLLHQTFAGEPNRRNRSPT